MWHHIGNHNYENLALIIHLSNVPYYDHATHRKQVIFPTYLSFDMSRLVSSLEAQSSADYLSTMRILMTSAQSAG